MIGVFVNKNGSVGFIPCKPSPITKEMDTIVMDDDILIQNYNNTIEFLNLIHSQSNNKIPCKPILKVIENNALIVGIITETDQFIQVEPISVENTNDEIDTHEGYNFNQLDENNTLLSINDYDTTRTMMIKKIQLESHFYNIFRNTIRVLLNQHNIIETRKEMEKILKNPFLLYSKKLNDIQNILKKLLKDYIKFQIFDDNMIDNIDNINELVNCLGLTDKRCQEKQDENLCMYEEGGKCRLILPEKHLYNNNDNKVIYFSRISDEFIRYGRIRQFMFNPQSFISFQKIGYNLKDDEIILLDNLLAGPERKGSIDDYSKGYFDDLVPLYDNPFIINKKNLFGINPTRTNGFPPIKKNTLGKNSR